MRKTFSFILVCIFAFLFTVTAQAEICMTCHDSIISTVESSDQLQVEQTVLPGQAFTQETISYTAIISGPDFALTQSDSSEETGQFYAHTKSDYLEEPDNPVTDEANLFRGIMTNMQNVPDTIPAGSIYFTNVTLE